MHDTAAVGQDDMLGDVTMHGRAAADAGFLAEGGEVGRLMRSQDWSTSPLGHPDSWPHALRLVVSLLLSSKFPMFVAWGPQLGFLYNDAYAEILSAKHPSALGQRFHDVWSEIWSDISPLIDAAMAGEATFARDLPLLMRRKGFDEQTWFTFSYSPVRDDSGQIAGMFCACTETTGQVVAESALRESETRFRNVADHAPMMMWVTDPSGYCTYLNRAWYEFTGQTPEQAEGFGWLDATHPDDRAEADRVFREANESRGAFRVEYRLRRHDGAYRWAIDAAAPRFGDDGEYLGYVGSVIDIDERRDAEERQRDSEARLRTLTDALPAFVWFATPDGELHQFNDRWYEYTGQTPEEALPNGWLATLHPDDVERTGAAWAHAREQGINYEIEVRYRRADGAYRWYLARAEPLRDAAGTITGWVGTSSDIHDRKSAEDALRELNDTLEQRVTRAVAQREQVEDALRQSQKMEAVGQLTGGMAHDFNNLLTVIRGSVDLLRRPDLSDERRSRYVDAIADASDRASKLTSHLLAFARRQTLRPTVFDVRKSIGNLQEMLRTLAGSSVEVTLAVPDAPCPVDADPNQFDTAIVNMAVNARDAMKRGGTLAITVATASQLRSLRAHPARDGDFITVTLTDTGSGIPPEQIDRVFEPFFTTKGVGHGTGLGLSQVFGFAKQSGGEIVVESTPGVGATFTLYLPRASGQADAEGTASTGQAADTRTARVLVVEDNAEVGRFATEALDALGHVPRLASGGREALALLEQAQGGFDLVFSDVVMPEMTGIELGERIRQLYPTLPVILTSGYSTALAESGTHGFPLLQKPYSVDELARTIQDGLAGGGAAVNP
jgi:PAS domain S-box-containing protein